MIHSDHCHCLLVVLWPFSFLSSLEVQFYLPLFVAVVVSGEEDEERLKGTKAAATTFTFTFTSPRCVVCLFVAIHSPPSPRLSPSRTSSSHSKFHPFFIPSHSPTHTPQKIMAQSDSEEEVENIDDLDFDDKSSDADGVMLGDDAFEAEMDQDQDDGSDGDDVR